MTTVHSIRDETIVHLVLDANNDIPSLGPSTVHQLRQAVSKAETDGTSILFRSAGRAFCAGVDMSTSDSETDESLLAKFTEIELLLGAIRRARVPTAAVVAGPAVGAGADLAAACATRVGTDRASFRFPGYGFGLLLGTGRLTRLVGAADAVRLVGTGDKVDALEAARIGLLDAVLDATSEEATATTAARLARKDVSVGGSGSALLGAMQQLEEEAVQDDLARLVRSASEPGLAERFRAHRDRSRR